MLLGSMKRLLCSDWLPEEMGPSRPLGIARFDPPQEKKPIQQTYKVRNFLDNVGKGVKKKKKKAEDSQGNEDINDCPWFTVLKNTVGFLSWLSKQKALLIPNKAKSFCFIINLLLTKLIRSRWLIISLNPFFQRFLDFDFLDFVAVHKNNNKNKNSAISYYIACSPTVTILSGTRLVFFSFCMYFRLVSVQNNYLTCLFSWLTPTCCLRVLFVVKLTPCIQRSSDISLNKVVFPAPVGPVNTVTSPRRRPFRMLFNFGNLFHYK